LKWLLLCVPKLSPEIVTRSPPGAGALNCPSPVRVGESKVNARLNVFDDPSAVTTIFC